MTPLAPLGETPSGASGSPMPHTLTKQSSTKISNNSVVQALHLKEIYVAPSALGVVFQ
ncbi:hypothetical protein [Nostoc sp.]|uniref:hypothetical protein n=1 Tax=Nostoc sp. TaxID=1180 RepID=UPI002FF6E22F